MTHKILENAPMRTVIRADLLMKLDILLIQVQMEGLTQTIILSGQILIMNL